MIPSSLIHSFKRLSNVIPEDDWIEITLHWNSCNEREGRNAKWLPRLFVDDEFTKSREALAACLGNGNCLVFSSDVAEWEESPLDSLMAHELAHVFHIATGVAKEREADEELQARETMRRWGFDDSLIDVHRIRTRFFPESTPEIEEFIRKRLGQMQSPQS